MNNSSNGNTIPLLADDPDSRMASEPNNGKSPERGGEILLDIDGWPEFPSSDTAVEEGPGDRILNEASCSNAEVSMTNPFSFVGALDESSSNISPIDPFRNHTPSISGLYEWVKTVVMTPVAVVRVLAFGIVLSIGFLATKLAMMGWKDRDSPMPIWRCRLMWITRFTARCILFCWGYHWIRRIGKPASRVVAPIIVSNHMSFTDPIFYFYELFPSIVASETHDKIPLVGTIIRAMQVIYVDRLSSISRKHALAEIKRKASCNDFRQVMLFPEATTTNGKALISFQLGAFIPGFPVQPVVVKYPYVHFDPSWGKISLLKLIFRMLTQFHSFMEVEYLPVIYPSESKRENPVSFAKKVAHAMARAINVVQTEHTHGDLIIASKASQLGLVPSSAYLVEMAKMDRLFKLNTRDALVFLEKFAAMHPYSSGRVSIDNFLSLLGFPRTPFSEQIFSFFDVENEESITFSQFLYGSMSILKGPRYPLVCELAFKSCDTNCDNFLSKQEVERVLKLVFPCISENNVNQMFKLFALDSDVAVSWSDFKMCMENNPVYIALFSELTDKHGFSSNSGPSVGGPA